MKHRKLKIAGITILGLLLITASILFLKYSEQPSFMDRFRARNESVILLVIGCFTLRLAMIWSKQGGDV